MSLAVAVADETQLPRQERVVECPAAVRAVESRSCEKKPRKQRVREYAC